MRASSLVAVLLFLGCADSSGATPVLDAARDQPPASADAADLDAADAPPVDDTSPPPIDAADVAQGPDVTPPPDAAPPVDVAPPPDVAPPLDVAPPDVEVATDVTPPADVTPTDVTPPSDVPCGGACRPGFTCGGGLCRSATGIPAFGQVYMIVMENTSQGSLRGSPSAPYINGLLRTAAVAGAFRSVTHPSLPNYIALTSGGTQGITCDCQPGTASSACNITCLVLPNCNCNRAVAHIGDQLDAAMLPWRNYGQSMGAPCNTRSTGSYAVKHLPFLYYDNVRTNAARCAEHLRDTNDLAADLGSRAFSLVVPDLCHDMHDRCAPTNDAIRQGDDWLRDTVPRILAAPGFDRNGVLFIVWDEGNLSLFDDIVLIALGPTVRPGTTMEARNHYSLLATVEDGLGLPRIGSAAGASTLREMFR